MKEKHNCCLLCCMLRCGPPGALAARVSRESPRNTLRGPQLKNSLLAASFSLLLCEIRACLGPRALCTGALMEAPDGGKAVLPFLNDRRLIYRRLGMGACEWAPSFSFFFLLLLGRLRERQAPVFYRRL